MDEYRGPAPRPVGWDWYFEKDQVEILDLAGSSDQEVSVEGNSDERHNEAFRSLASIANELGVMVSLTVYPIIPDGSED